MDSPTVIRKRAKKKHESNTLLNRTQQLHRFRPFSFFHSHTRHINICIWFVLRCVFFSRPVLSSIHFSKFRCRCAFFRYLSAHNTWSYLFNCECDWYQNTHASSQNEYKKGVWSQEMYKCVHDECTFVLYIVVLMSVTWKILSKLTMEREKKNHSLTTFMLWSSERKTHMREWSERSKV